MVYLGLVLLTNGICVHNRAVSEIVFLRTVFKAYCSWNLIVIPKRPITKVVFSSFSQLLVKLTVVKEVRWLQSIGSLHCVLLYSV